MCPQQGVAIRIADRRARRSQRRRQQEKRGRCGGNGAATRGFPRLPVDHVGYRRLGTAYQSGYPGLADLIERQRALPGGLTAALGPIGFRHPLALGSRTHPPSGSPAPDTPPPGHMSPTHGDMCPHFNENLAHPSLTPRPRLTALTGTCVPTPIRTCVPVPGCSGSGQHATVLRSPHRLRPPSLSSLAGTTTSILPGRIRIIPRLAGFPHRPGWLFLIGPHP